MPNENGAPVVVCISRFIVEKDNRRKKPLSQKPICHPSQLYKRWRTIMFKTPRIMGWMTNIVIKKIANPMGGMYIRNAF
jgi:hypothetical protein